jgi:hypothetical protein
MQQIARVMLVAVFMLSLVQSAAGEEDIQKQIDQFGRRVDKLERNQGQRVTEIHRETGGVVLFLFGAFCALWAQNTNRNPWLWFFLGVFFNVITVLALLAQNADDGRIARGEPVLAGSLVVAVIARLVLVALMGAAVYLLFWESAA